MRSDLIHTPIQSDTKRKYGHGFSRKNATYMTSKTVKSLTSFFLLEGVPLVIFFTLFAYTREFSFAVLGLVCATFIATAISLVLHKRIPYFTLIAASTTTLAGLLTYLSNNPNILIFRDTLYYTIFGAAIFFMQKNNRLPLKAMFENIFAITNEGWKELCRRWGLFLILAGILNLLIGLALPLSYWVFYKSVLILIFLLFGSYQLTLTKKYAQEDANSLGLRQ